jgi:hypothetical protein
MPVGASQGSNMFPPTHNTATIIPSSDKATEVANGTGRVSIEVSLVCVLPRVHLK